MQTDNYFFIIALGAFVLGFVGFGGVFWSLYMRIKAIGEIKSKVSKKSAEFYLNRFISVWGENSTTRNIKKVAPHISGEIDRILKAQKIFWVSLVLIILGVEILLYYPFGR